MENFKSFGQKLIVPFFPGFTAITGPNGSGKSNIADAILFVLGPRSSKVVRAGRLTDLIFNGGKKHKNPAKFCKVSLVFDNIERKMPVDSDEVILTRMIKRAPLKNDPNNYYSKFYINEKSATFSDFVNVLNHARMSGDGYNIIKQGDITSFIERGGVERRKLIDDIAGISIFDSDIKKAEIEKTQVDNNLERINIILNEINTQIRQLKNDRDAAYRYNELKDRLYETKAKITSKKKQDVETQITEIQKQIESYELEKTQLVEKSNKLKEEYSENKNKLEKIEEQIADIGGDEVKEIKEKIDDIRSDEIKIEERINYSNDEIQNLQNEQIELKTSFENLKKELNENNLQKDKFEEEIQKKQIKLKEKDKELTELKETIAQSDDKSMDITHELTKMREEFDQKNSELHELQLKQDRLNENLDKLDLQIAEFEETKNTYEFELKDINWQSQEFQKEGNEKNKKTKLFEKNLFDYKKKEVKLTEQLTDIENAIRNLEREKAKLQAEFDALQSINGQYNRAVHEILKARNEKILTGVHGTIAELAKVDDKYKTALETAAGNRLQSIIVDDDEVAAKAIKFLKKQNLGRATFLPINKMLIGKPRGQALMVKNDSKTHGFAIDLVKFNPGYRGAFWYVFGDTLVVDTLDDARRLMGGVRLVDLQGSLIEPTGAMRGGSISKAQLSFSKNDRTRLDKISKELKDAIEIQEKLIKEITSLKKDIAEIENNLSDIRSQAISDIQIKDLEVRRKDFSAKLEIINKEFFEKNNEKNKLTNELEDLIKKIEDYHLRLDELDKIKEEKGKILLKGTKKEMAQKARILEEEFSKLQGDILITKSDKEAIIKKIQLLLERKEELEKNTKNKENQINEFKENIKDLKEKRSVLKNDLNALMKIEEKMTGDITEYTQKRDVIYRKTVTTENELDKINTRIESYYDLISRAKYRLPTLDEAINELNQELKLYKVTLKTDEKLPNVESLKDSMKVIEESMHELEPVNMRALEEYEHQSERKNKLDEDIKHLKDQKKNLIKLVKEVTEKKKERFFEVFEAVNKNFKEVYAQLSEDGEAELQLENPDTVFESGMTIKARPNGKKVLLLNALSGGEKSIASLAFIFAIQHYDPSPFYVLDEVDMFLDGVNAETVSRMVKQKALDSQFIMVSLRKVALKEANHVYGVTMRETGISEMIGNIDSSTVSINGEFKLEGGKIIATN